MKRIFTIIFLYCPFFVFAQQNPDLNFHLEGKIIDKESKQVIPNAKISIINFAGKSTFPFYPSSTTR